MKQVDLFHIGPQKSATTWVYNCLKEHPEVAVPNSDTIHYYDMFYARSEAWYYEFFDHATEDQILYDPTTTYIRSPWAPRRIAEDHPDAKIMLCLRNPIDRAFSHYWHEKKKGKINFEFEEVLENYDLYSSWIEPGFYAKHIERYLQYFDREQVLCMHFETLQDDEVEFIRQILRFAGVDENFEPSWLNKKSNEAGGRRTITNRMWRGLKGAVAQSELESIARRLQLDKAAQHLETLPTVGSFLKDKQEYEQGIPSELREELVALCEPEIQRLENLLDIRFPHWRSANS
jgi:hypothetical protein